MATALIHMCEHESIELEPSPHTPAGNVRANVRAGDRHTATYWGDEITIKYSPCKPQEEAYHAAITASALG